ncbi:MAG: class I adenylate cyclase [Syntrophales bacterium]|nr:class I adenylate cyclase [Syntrophales bacterium]
MDYEEFIKNKKTFLAYNYFRKKIFQTLSPKEGEVVTYLLPWLLSVNHPGVPGYVQELKKGLIVHGIQNEREISMREKEFKRIFDLKIPGSLLNPPLHSLVIQGLYTIGSVGTINQNALSDCDIWICINSEDFDRRSRECLSRKVNLIKDWLDENIRIPVYFFICDVKDIAKARFGIMDEESSGSAQGKVLLEEFYRTMILLGGKIPLWWIAYGRGKKVDYERFIRDYGRGKYDDYDGIDLGNLEAVDREEFFGAALWQFNKALTHPLKSVIKMLILAMFLKNPEGALLSRQFRDRILDDEKEQAFVDPALFTMGKILEHYRDEDIGTKRFIYHCFYLITREASQKGVMSKEIGKLLPLSQEEKAFLDNFAQWPIERHISFGEEAFKLLGRIFRQIKPEGKEVSSRLTERDMMGVGRKLAVCLEKKPGKVSVIHKPVPFNRIFDFKFIRDKRSWQLYAGANGEKPILSHANIIYLIAWLVWNDLYAELAVRMAPNPTSMTIQEIKNLARKIKDVFGSFNIGAIAFESFFERERIVDLLVVLNFENQVSPSEIEDFSVLYKNQWGELFCQHFRDIHAFKSFLDERMSLLDQARLHFYIRRSVSYYEKNIERTKLLIANLFTHLKPPLV